jgi:hypothetical protein
VYSKFSKKGGKMKMYFAIDKTGGKKLDRTAIVGEDEALRRYAAFIYNTTGNCLIDYFYDIKNGGDSIAEKPALFKPSKEKEPNNANR